MSSIKEVTSDFKENDLPKSPEYNVYLLLENIKLIEHIHYVVKDNTLKEKETLKLLELRDNIVNSL